MTHLFDTQIDTQKPHNVYKCPANCSSVQSCSLLDLVTLNTYKKNESQYLVALCKVPLVSSTQ